MKTHIKPLVGLVALATASTGFAQQLEEIVVTAQKREQSLSDVPMSVSAVSGEQVQDAAIASFRELGAYVPNLSISENAVNTIISMRGIGVGAQQSFEQSVGVFVDGVHLGKSRQARLGLFDLEQIEVLRGPQGILFGKNTLAGAMNIRSASPELGGSLEGRLAVSMEDNNGEIYEGWIQNSITDNFAIRFAMKDRKSDGFNQNSFATPGSGSTPNAPTTDERIWRLSAKWEASDSTVVNIKYLESDYVRLGGQETMHQFSDPGLQAAGIPGSNSVMYAVMGIVFPGFTPNPTDAFQDAKSVGGNLLDGSGGYGGPNERDAGTNTKNEELSISIEHEFDNGITMNYVYGDSFYGYKDGIDADFLPVQFIGRSDDSTFNQESHELRFNGSIGDNVDWIGGFNFVDSEQKIDRLVVVDGTLGYAGAVNAVMSGALTPSLGCLLTSIDPTFTGGDLAVGNCGVVPGTPSFLAANPLDIMAAVTGVPFSPDAIPVYQAVFGANPGLLGSLYGSPAFMANQFGRLSYWQQNTQSSAAFMQGTMRFNDAWSLTAGVRFTKEEKDVVAETDLVQDWTGLMNPQSPAEAPFLHGLGASSFGSYAHNFVEDRSTNQTIPGVTLQFEPNENSNYYLSYAEGFKSGGFNSVDDQNPVIAPDGTVLRDQPGLGFEYDDETARSIELGGKHTLMDGSMQLNWNIYSSTYNDLQVSTFVGLGFVVANAASADIQGIEIDLNYQVTEKLRVALALALNDGSYGSFPGAGCTALQQNGLNALGITGPDAPVIEVDGCVQQFLGDGTPSGQSQNLAGAQIGTEYNGSAQIEYMQPLSNGMVWFTQVDYNFTDDYYMTGDRDPVQIQNGYGLLNARTGLRTDNWMVMAYGRNLTDEMTSTGGYDIPLAQGSHGRYRAPGQVVGFQVAFEF
jgi:outer membrane receptor protein involved in Fe transport